ncbi:hypothetical protein DMH04_41315 [Kibdelosporangium aridum]|uniref:Uncharacterized protein n=1 Tax=Kibdelosporangium aridum TaxID=2030 RepID=A0A428YUS8_KIBAR|nr:hypothetical protein [Kibdelosporangium aridum]RSM73454.1 hypothetical protein DMH04_41315 [Kibdelosporangium aridum]
MTSSRFEINPGAIEAILRGPQSQAQKKRQAEKIADAWRGNINDITGATDRSIDVEQQGFEVTVAADSSRDPESAWVYLEWGTSKMRAQAPGRRAIRRR